MLEEVVVDNCLTEIVEEMEVTTDVVDIVTERDWETMDLEDVMLTLKSFFFLLIESVVVIFSVVVCSSELNLIAPSQDASLPLLWA